MILTSFFNMTSRVRDAAGGDEGAGASEERASTEAQRTPKQPGPNRQGNLIGFKNL